MNKDIKKTLEKKNQTENKSKELLAVDVSDDALKTVTGGLRNLWTTGD